MSSGILYGARQTVCPNQTPITSWLYLYYMYGVSNFMNFLCKSMNKIISLHEQLENWSGNTAFAFARLMARRIREEDWWESLASSQRSPYHCIKKINELLVKLFELSLRTANDPCANHTHKHSLYVLHVSSRANLNFAVQLQIFNWLERQG